AAVEGAGVRPAATSAPPLRADEAITATAPTPSASVDNPSSVVNSPQTMKRMPTKSTCVFTNARSRVGFEAYLKLTGQAADERIAMRTSTRCAAASGDFRRNRKQAPSAMRGGSVTRSG